MYHAGLVIPVIGAARAALEEYEQIILTKTEPNFLRRCSRNTDLA